MSTRPRMPAPSTPAPGKLPITELAELKARGQPIAMVTAYDAPGGRLADAAGVDVVLVGDSAAMTMLAFSTSPFSSATVASFLAVGIGVVLLRVRATRKPCQDRATRDGRRKTDGDSAYCASAGCD